MTIPALTGGYKWFLQDLTDIPTFFPRFQNFQLLEKLEILVGNFTVFFQLFHISGKSTPNRQFWRAFGRVFRDGGSRGCGAIVVFHGIIVKAVLKVITLSWKNLWDKIIFWPLVFSYAPNGSNATCIISQTIKNPSEMIFTCYLSILVVFGLLREHNFFVNIFWACFFL